MDLNELLVLLTLGAVAPCVTAAAASRPARFAKLPNGADTHQADAAFRAAGQGYRFS